MDKTNKNQDLDESRIDGVLDLEKEKVFRLQGPVIVLQAGEEAAFSNPVSVWDSAGRVIGYATLSVEDLVLLADISLTYSNPERLSIQAGTSKFYLRAVGAIGIYTTYIDYLILSESKPTDPRITEVKPQ